MLIILRDGQPINSFNVLPAYPSLYGKLSGFHLVHTDPNKLPAGAVGEPKPDSLYVLASTDYDAPPYF